MTKKESDYVAKVIFSCKTYEQLLTCKDWINRLSKSKIQEEVFFDLFLHKERMLRK